MYENNEKFTGKYKGRWWNIEQCVLEENKFSKNDNPAQVQLKSLEDVKQNKQMKTTEVNNYKIIRKEWP